MSAGSTSSWPAGSWAAVVDELEDDDEPEELPEDATVAVPLAVVWFIVADWSIPGWSCPSIASWSWPCSALSFAPIGPSACTASSDEFIVELSDWFMVISSLWKHPYSKAARTSKTRINAFMAANTIFSFINVYHPASRFIKDTSVSAAEGVKT